MRELGLNAGRIKQLRAISLGFVILSTSCGGGSNDAGSDVGSETQESALATSSSTSPPTSQSVPMATDESKETSEVLDIVDLEVVDSVTVDEPDLITYVDVMAAGADGVWVAILQKDEADSLGRAALIDPLTNTIVLDVAVPSRPGDIVASDGAAWVYGFADRTLTRVDAVSGETLAVGEVCGFGAANDDVWVSDDEGVVKVDNTTGARVGPTSLISAAVVEARVGDFGDMLPEHIAASPDRYCGVQLAASDEVLWYIMQDSLVQADVETGEAVHLVGLAGADRVWSTLPTSDGLWLLVAAEDQWDPDTDELWFVPLGGDVSWRVRLEGVSGRTSELATDGVHLFVVGQRETIAIIDMASGEQQPTASFEFSHYRGLAVSNGSMFITGSSPFSVQVIR